MTLFREHRGGLDESLKTLHRVEDRAELVAHLQALLGRFNFKFAPEQLHIKHYGLDPRTRWDTYLVTIDGYGVAGYTDGPLPSL